MSRSIKFSFDQYINNKIQFSRVYFKITEEKEEEEEEEVRQTKETQSN